MDVVQVLKLAHEIFRPSETDALALEVAVECDYPANIAGFFARGEQDDLDAYARQWDREAAEAGNEMAEMWLYYRGYLDRREGALAWNMSVFPELDFASFYFLWNLDQRTEDQRQVAADALPHLREQILDIKKALYLE